MTDPRELEPDPPDYQPPDIDDDWENLIDGGWEVSDADT